MTRDNNCSISARHKLSLMGVIVTLGIVFGDIGTSPLYVMKAIVRAENLLMLNIIIGAVSCYYMDI